MGAVRFDEEFDVVVLGVGAAGAAAALSAHAAGARVVVLDKADPATAAWQHPGVRGGLVHQSRPGAGGGLPTVAVRAVPGRR